MQTPRTQNPEFNVLKIKPNFFVIIIFPFFPLFPAVHIIAHLFNFEFFMDAQLNRNSSYLPFILSQIGTGDNASFLNPIRSNETVSPEKPNLIFTTSHSLCSLKK